MIKKASILQKRALNFSVRIVRIYNYFSYEKKDCTLLRNFLSSGTSIGANVQEGLKEKEDINFILKLYTSFEKAEETRYWINLLASTNYLSIPIKESLLNELEYLIRGIKTVMRRV